MKFSIVHTSARPNKWREVYESWMSHAVDAASVEYVLVIDPRWGFSTDPADYETALDNIVLVLNNRRRCYVDGVNLGAAASSGDVLIVNADDQFPCSAWDNQLADVIGNRTGEFVVEVSTGTPDEHLRGIFVMPVLSRARLKAQGGTVFYPEYESMFADNDFCAAARQDGVVIDGRNLGFPHIHPMFKTSGEWVTPAPGDFDEAYRAQNRNEAYTLGLEIFKRRSAQMFPKPSKRRTIALCLTGEHFDGVWLDAILDLQAHLIDKGFDVVRFRSYTSNVYVTREDLRRGFVNCERVPDLALWIDDDNPVLPSHFELLLETLDANPDVDGVSAWCWIHNRQKTGFFPSCGLWAPDHLHWDPFPATFARGIQPVPFEVGGFPCFLMRRSAIEKAGEGCFLPVLDSRMQHGMTGEDISFFLNAEKGGAKFLVDPRVRVPHLKTVTVEPVLPEEGAAPAVKVACMIRAKNEGRWIARTIASVKALCGADVFVMEDGSTDDTVAQAEAAGAVVLSSPFAGMGLDERRDKNWLLAEVMARCSPDWIFMPDGDEELEPGGCEKIRRALESNPPVDAFALRFLYLWDSVNTARLDGVYGSMLRQSLFRASNNLSFRSYYEGEGANTNHVGLHVSNAPGLGTGIKVSPLNVFLLHYGYLHREDRIRKYEWIVKLDPKNEAEDFYRHTVQGDIPEVPKGAKLKHAGPLDLRELPGRLVPRFDSVPGPREVLAAMT